MNYNWTNQSLKILEQIKKEIIINFKNKEPNKKNRYVTKKKVFVAVPLPYNNPAFQLYINDKFYRSYFFKNNEWIEIG
jgi:hypothetical protein